MRHPVTIFLHLACLVGLSASAGFAENKSACELLTKGDAEEVLGVTLQPLQA